MVRKSSVWLVVLISVVAIAFIVSGCAKKQIVKQETTPQTAVVPKKEEAKSVVPKKEEAKPEVPKPVEKPKEQAPAPKAEVAPIAKPKEEAKTVSKTEAVVKSEIKPVSLDLSGLHLQFAFDDYNLSTQSKENLDKVASWMKKDPNARIEIQGYTCDIGTAEYNLALGERRANSAKKYLEALGVEAARLSTISYGEERPRVPNIDEGHRSMNRRDEFVAGK
jgi:peptidoglycan-associated lipoprotein